MELLTIWTGILLLIVSVLYIKFLVECCNGDSHNLARIYCEFIVCMILLIIVVLNVKIIKI